MITGFKQKMHLKQRPGANTYHTALQQTYFFFFFEPKLCFVMARNTDELSQTASTAAHYTIDTIK